ncbi:TetR/AcrR family transcriptional regulator [Methylobacterium brachythecii]|uniref:AcrR family transcriptional regulator n=1 Tax=Methylobacterium brachythecii TaxID=1176177 RepID=A0A7W6AKX9_9HYPH|nr:TetR/AcrR family transcriptional regulator [Methylobacterium brachythecii]MBB3903609.1 AcrR family transcriptional regulator [Methylobacterium brachythecii]GLS46919.1 hypothetical protein GCM10007884_49180 [Methylobacterium brachythecii]
MTETSARPYRQVARAAATEKTQRRIVEVFFEQLRSKWLDEITLDAVAAGAGTTRQTVIRLFGGKDRLIAAANDLAYEKITGRRRLPPDASPAAIARILVADYEIDGDTIVRLLAQEQQHPELTPILIEGRAGHRAWINDGFSTWLDRVPASRREGFVDELVAVTDIYVWKLFRRDFGHGAPAVTDLIAGLLSKVLAEASR